MIEDSADRELQALRALSAALGRNRFRTQAAGGNTSIKRNGVMWIKASGRRLADAMDQDIMVPVALDGLRAAALRNDPAADGAAAFVIEELNPSKLRPSIETSVHAIVPQTVVTHIHCVETIALAVRENASDLVADRLRGLDGLVWSFVPYRRPGLPLARAIIETAAPGANVLILGNHGLVVSGDSVAEVESLTERVCAALSQAPRPAPRADIAAIEGRARNSEYRLPKDEDAHALAIDPASLLLANGASLYPDHVIFLGRGIVVAPDVATGASMRGSGGTDSPPPMLILPGTGILLHRSTTRAADAMALCLADVVARIPGDAELLRLSPAQEFELTNWEAEKYRQGLAARTSS